MRERKGPSIDARRLLATTTQQLSIVDQEDFFTKSRDFGDAVGLNCDYRSARRRVCVAGVDVDIENTEGINPMLTGCWHSSTITRCTILTFVGLMIAVLASPARAQGQLTWQQVDNDSPTPRYYHAVAFDSDRSVLVLFGGNTGETDTWEWNTGTETWSLRATTGPSRRGGHAMVYDPDRQVTVLTGGWYKGTTFNEVWEWEGVSGTWTRRTGSAELPEPRNVHAMVYDSDRDRVVLYGGTTLAASSNARKVLEFVNGTEWIPVTTETNPGDQSALAMAYDEQCAVTVMTTSGDGGFDTPVWEYGYDLNVMAMNWRIRSFENPVPDRRPNPKLVYDAFREVTVLHAGNNVNTWTYDCDEWTLAGTGPRRSRSALAYDPESAEVLMFSGNIDSCECDAFRQLHAWNGIAWSDPPRWSKTSLAPRMLGAVSYDENRQKTVFFGGRQLNPSNYVGIPPYPDTWEWDGVSWIRADPAHSPGSRWRAPSVYDSSRGVVVLYGGTTADGASTAVATTWEFDGTDWIQRPDGPGRRFRHGTAFDRVREKVLVFGGSNENDTALADTWEYDGASGVWTQVATTGPSARIYPAMVYDIARDKTILFGGESGGARQNDTWEWNGSEWTEVAIPLAERPPTRSGAVFAYDHDRALSVLYAGFASGSGNNAVMRDDVWTFDGTQWSQQSGLPPTIARWGMGFVYDTARDVFVLAGGSSTPDDNFITAQTWEARFPCLTDIAPPGGDGQVTVSDILAVITAFGLPCDDCPQDIVPPGGDGQVTVSDILAALTAFGPCP